MDFRLTLTFRGYYCGSLPHVLYWPLLSSAKRVALTISSLRKYELLGISSPHCALQMPLSPRVIFPVPIVPKDEEPSHLTLLHSQSPSAILNSRFCLSVLAHPSTLPGLFLSLHISPWLLCLTYFSLFLLKLSQREDNTSLLPPLPIIPQITASWFCAIISPRPQW